MIVFYMDDGTISGRARDVADAFERLRDLAMTKAGFSVSTRKSTVMSAYFRDEDAMDLDAMSRSEEHTSELQSLMRISYAVFCLKKKKYNIIKHKLVLNTQKTQHHI